MQSSTDNLNSGHKLESKKRSRLYSFPNYLGIIIFVSSFSIYLATLNGIWSTDHSTAIVEFQYSLWLSHSFSLGRMGSFNPNTVDAFQYNGNYYMANAPGVAFFTLPFAIVAFVLNGYFTVYGNVLLLTEVPIALANSLAAYFVFKISNFYSKKNISTFLAFSFAFSTISWPFATYLFQSDVSALFDLIAVYFVIKIDRSNKMSQTFENKKVRFAGPLLCGLAISGGILVDYVNGVLIPIIGIYMLVSLRKENLSFALKSVLGFILGSIFVSFSLLGLYNYLSFGKVFVSSEQLYLHSSSLFGNFSFPIDMGIILNLFTPMRGLFLFSPILILGCWGLWKMMRDPKSEKDSFLFFSVFLGILGLYSAWYEPTGGLSFGPRLIIPSIPFLLIPAGFVISKAEEKYSYTFVYLLYATGVIVNGLAAIVGALVPPSENWLTSPFLSSIIPKFASNNVDIWWKVYVGNLWVIGVAFILGFVLLIPMVCGYFSEQFNDRELLMVPGEQILIDPEIK